MKNENTQHTPAPWFSHESEEMIFISNDSDITKGTVIGTTTMSDGQSWSGSIETDRANAQLIASAPELLKENEQLKKEVEYQKFYCQKELSRKNDLYLSLEEINREMLEALKSARYELTLCMGMATEQDEKDATKHVIENVESAIAKADGKTLVGS